jgi:cystathionine beta-lyase
VSSYAIVPNDTLRRRFYTWLEANELNDPPLFAPIATIAAYQQGEEWRRQMLSYVEENVLFVEDYCRDYLPGIKPWRPQASFLVWLDCRELGITHNELIHLFVDKAHLALNDGAMFFGDPRHADDRKNFMRLNVAAPRSVLKTALEQLKSALK